MESNLDESCDDDVDSSYTCQQDQLESINECLKAIGETPVVKKKLVHTSYQKEKLCKIKDAAANALLPSIYLATIPTKIDDGCEIIEQLKEKFHASIVAVRKRQFLQFFPKAGVQEELISLEQFTSHYPSLCIQNHQVS